MRPALILAITTGALAQATPDDQNTKTKQHAGKKADASAAKGLPNSIEFKATAAEMAEAMRADSAANQKEPLSFPKGNGLRILMTGHSWVAPARRTLPEIAKAAGLDGHHQRSHTSGGSTGSANAIWLTEFGKFKDKPKTPILMPAIATGQWDVMTWGAYIADKPEYYTQWMEVCLKQNPKMIFYIQDGWPTYIAPEKDAVAADTIKAIDARQTEIQSGMFKELYAALEVKYPGKVHIIPAGAAVVEMLHHYYEGKLPGFDCASEHLGGTKGVYRDGGHLSGTLEHLVGYMYYGMLYRKSPAQVTGYKPAGVDPKVDALMRAAAWNAITHSPYSGVTDVNKNGIADASEAR